MRQTKMAVACAYASAGAYIRLLHLFVLFASSLCAVCLSIFFVFSPDLFNKNGAKITTTTQNVHSRNKRFRRSMCSCALLLLLLVDKHEIRDYNHINERNTSHISHKTHVINLPVTVCICAIHTRQTRSQSCQICLLIGF